MSKTPQPSDSQRSGWLIIGASLVWLVSELAGVFSKRNGDTFTEVYQGLMATSPATAWTLGGLCIAICLWLPPHMILGADWRWLLWSVLVSILVSLATWGLLSNGILTR